MLAGICCLIHVSLAGNLMVFFLSLPVHDVSCTILPWNLTLYQADESQGLQTEIPSIGYDKLTGIRLLAKFLY